MYRSSDRSVVGVAVIFTVNLLSADAVYMRVCERECVCVCMHVLVCLCVGGGVRGGAGVSVAERGRG